MNCNSVVVSILSFVCLFFSGQSAPRFDPPIRHGNRQLKRIKYRDCGRRFRKAIEIKKLDLQPMPIAIPGRLELRMKPNVTRPIPNNVNIHLNLKKRYFDSRKGRYTWDKIPCWGEFGWVGMKIGSCKYRDIETCSITNDILGCPIQRKYYDVDEFLSFDDPGWIARLFLAGDYKAKVKVRHPVTNKILACINGQFSIADTTNMLHSSSRWKYST